MTMEIAFDAAAAATPSHRATPSLLAGLKAPAAFKAIGFACLNLKEGALLMRLPDGRILTFGDERGAHHEMIVHDFAFAKRVLHRGDIGFAEGYMAGEWSAARLGELLMFLSSNADRITRVFRGGRVTRAINNVWHRLRDNSKSGARRNIYEHYDLGNAFYGAWLDPSMTYSSARFADQAATLEAAQLEKYRNLARMLDLKPGDRVLEIGCGWGGFAEVAARDFGAHVTGLTISEAQHAFAVKRIESAGLARQVDIRLQDYRDTYGQFDKVASIEMFEAVGERYWPDYFSKIAEVLKPGGRAALQIITIRDDLFESYRRRMDFIQRYVFPGGMLPSLSRLREETDRAGLSWTQYEAFGEDYARTLRLWDQQFQDAWPEIRTMGFDDAFKRLWRFYLNYCYAGFASKRTDVIQLALTKA